MGVRETLQRAIRPSRTHGTAALWAKSLLNAVVFFLVFMIALPWGSHALLPVPVPVPAALRTWGAAALVLVGVVAWALCLDSFSRQGRGTPLPADAPRHLVTTGLFGRLRNPIMASELLVIWAVAFAVSSLGVVLYAVAISILAHVLVVGVEEPELRERFGARYEEYCRSVPRWLPRLRRGT